MCIVGMVPSVVAKSKFSTRSSVTVVFHLNSPSCRETFLVAFLIAVLLTAWFLPAVAANGGQAGFTEWELPRGDWAHGPEGIIVDSQGVWFTCFFSANIGHLTSDSNTVELWSVGTPGVSSPTQLTSYGGSIYFTDSSEDKIGKLLPSMDKVSYAGTPTANSRPFGITFPEIVPLEYPTLIFTEYDRKQIGTLTMSGLVFDLLLSATRSTTTITPTFNVVDASVTDVLPTITPGGPGTTPGVAAVSPTVSGPFSEWVAPIGGSPITVIEKNGIVWFGVLNAPQIGKLTFQDGPDRFDIYYLPTTSSSSADIEMDTSGNIWYTTRLGNIIGKLDPSTLTVSEWTIPTSNSDPSGLALDSSGKVWFTENDAHKIGMLDPSADKFYEWRIPADEYAAPSGIFIDSDDNVWFTERWRIGCLNRNGEMVPELPVQSLILLLALSTVLLVSSKKFRSHHSIA